ncbi:MAG: hypothetical protein HYZ72_03905 [Deltaproteobacteria bacterium]|nr:hypothetical protein [Deltaproteobacteria bacterium]
MTKVHTMKSRITLTMDPQIARRAKQLAHARKTSVSALIEEFLRSASLTSEKGRLSFAQKWAGKFRVASSPEPDPRLEALKARYHLDDE